MGAEGENTRDENLLIVLRHPRRRRVLKLIIERGRISPREIADELDESLSNVGYHVQFLARHGAATLVDTAQVRGSTQHFYSATIEEPWALDLLELDEGGKPPPDGDDQAA